jgi:flagellin
MAEIANLLTSMRQLAIHASNEAVNDDVMLEADQKEMENALTTIDRIANQAQFGQKKLLDGSRGASGVTTGDNLEFVDATLMSGDSRENGFEVKVTELATRANVAGTQALTNDVIKAGEALTVIENGKLASYTSNEDDTAATTIQNLKSEIGRKGLNVDVILNDQGMIEVYHKEFGSEFNFQVMSSTAGILGKEGGEINVANRGSDIKGTINGESAVGKGQILTGVEGAKCVDGLSVRYTGNADNRLVDMGCQVADLEVTDTTPEKPPIEVPEDGVAVGRVFVSQNSMKFQVGGNRGQTVGISVTSANPETLARGIVNQSGYKSLNDIDVRNFQGAQDALTLIDDAINSISSIRGDLGAFQKNTLEANLSNVRIANENLISSESVIRDVDMAKEMASFTRNQIMTESATAMLAQANQLPQNVLQLLG